LLKYQKFSDDDIKKICKNIEIIIDTREKACKNVKEWCDHKNRCKYRVEKLDYGDYSFYLPAIPEYGINEPMHFAKHFVIEKKNSLDEISQNFTKERSRFKHEINMCPAKMIICINDEWTNLFQGNYKSKYNRTSFIASVMSFEHEYDINFRFVNEKEFPVFIYTQFYYYLRNLLK